jgi:hypothetical protein
VACVARHGETVATSAGAHFAVHSASTGEQLFSSEGKEGAHTATIRCSHHCDNFILSKLGRCMEVPALQPLWYVRGDSRGR